MDRGRVTSGGEFDYNFVRSKNYRTFRHERINWLPVVVSRRWDHRWMAAAACSDRSVGAGTPVASRTVSQRKSWKSSSWRNCPRRPGSDRWANRCTHCLCSKIGHCEAATIADASQSRGSRCTHIHRIRHSWWWCCWLQLRIKQEKWQASKSTAKLHKERRQMCRLGRFSLGNFRSQASSPTDVCLGKTEVQISGRALYFASACVSPFNS